MTATMFSPVTTGRGGGEARPELPRREMEARLRAVFPNLSRSQANKIIRRHLRLSSAMQEAKLLISGVPARNDRPAYRDPTADKAVKNVMRGGGR